MTTKIFTLDQIREALKSIDAVKAIEEGFVVHSLGKTVIPPVGEMLFDNPPGDVHIKYGHIIGGEYYVIKIASGFYENVKLGISSSQGLMLVFNQKTGETAGILLDEGHLTNIRTAAAGAVAARYLAPAGVSCVGVVGAGIQGRMQVVFLRDLVPCRDIMVWGITKEECDAYKKYMESRGYRVKIAAEPAEIGRNCQLIITCTPSRKPLLMKEDIRRGTHITAMGSDTPQKIELDPEILRMADIVAADSIEQCRTRGEIFRAVSAGAIDEKKPEEIGNIIMGHGSRRTAEDQITVADLTGVAVQDIQIAVAVLKELIK